MSITPEKLISLDFKRIKNLLKFRIQEDYPLGLSKVMTRNNISSFEIDPFYSCLSKKFNSIFEYFNSNVKRPKKSQ